MHDLISALFFIAMVITPAIVAAVSGKEREGSAKKSASVQPLISVPSQVAPTQTPVRETAGLEAATLPLHRTIGLADR